MKKKIDTKNGSPVIQGKILYNISNKTLSPTNRNLNSEASEYTTNWLKELENPNIHPKRKLELEKALIFINAFNAAEFNNNFTELKQLKVKVKKSKRDEFVNASNAKRRDVINTSYPSKREQIADNYNKKFSVPYKKQEESVSPVKTYSDKEITALNMKKKSEGEL